MVDGTWDEKRGVAKTKTIGRGVELSGPHPVYGGGPAQLTGSPFQIHQMGMGLTDS